jgi:hypothetical protein
MQLNPGAFNRHLAHMGQQVRWRRAYSCPCTNEFSGASLPNCPQCNGKGHIWTSPGVDSVIGVTQQKINPKWQEFGNYEQGDVTLSIPADSPLYEIGRFDRVMLMNATERFSRIYTHGQNERLDVPVVEITRVFWLNEDKTAQVEGGIPTFDGAGNLTWSSGEPPAGMQYSIAGTRHVEYYVWDELPQHRNEHSGATLPKKVPARRFDLFGR